MIAATPDRGCFLFDICYSYQDDFASWITLASELCKLQQLRLDFSVALFRPHHELTEHIPTGLPFKLTDGAECFPRRPFHLPKLISEQR